MVGSILTHVPKLNAVNISYIMKRQRITKTLRLRVWDENGGKGKRYLTCNGGCGRQIDFADSECGHIVAHANGGTTALDNLLPICGSCNKSMGTRNLHEFVESQGLKGKKKAPNTTAKKNAPKTPAAKNDKTSERSRAPKKSVVDNARDDSDEDADDDSDEDDAIINEELNRLLAPMTLNPFLDSFGFADEDKKVKAKKKSAPKKTHWKGVRVPTYEEYWEENKFDPSNIPNYVPSLNNIYMNLEYEMNKYNGLF